MKTMKKIFLLALIVTGSYLALQGWNDEDLFTTVVRTGAKPNVVFLQDNSGSMAEGIYHPDYDPNTVTTYSTSSAYFTEMQATLTKTIWHERWVDTSNGRIYSPPYANINQDVSVQTQIRVDGNGSYIAVGDYIIAKSNAYGILASAKVTAKSGSNPYTLTLDNATRIGTFARNQYVATAARIEAVASNTITVNAAGSYINVGDYILAGNSNAIGKVTAKQLVSPNYVLTLDSTLDSNIFKPKIFSVGDFVYVTKYTITNRTSRVVKLYGTNIKQPGGNVWYDQDSGNYLEWIFSVAIDAQRNQVSMFSTLGAHIEQRCYTDRVSPLIATNPDNTGETLLAEWNRVWPQMFPNKIAALGSNINNTVTTINYSDAEDSFQGYTSNFYIKIDSETMLVNSNTAGGTTESGTLTVTRAQKNTLAKTHPSGSKIMIYNQAAPLVPEINEYTPVTSLFSGTQHVDEPTGIVEPTWTEFIDPDDGGSLPLNNYYRYKRVFSRIQVAREALSDVATAKNKLLKVATLDPSIDESETTLKYLNGSANFVTMDPAVETFYIKVSDPDHPDHDEVMLVTGHDRVSIPHILTVIRAQNGTTAHDHNIGSAIQIYTGVRDEVIIGLFRFPDPTLVQNLTDFGQKNADGTYTATSYINPYLDKIWDIADGYGGNTPIAIAAAEVWRYFKPGPSASTGSGAYRTTTTADDWQVVTKKWGFEKLDGINWRPIGSPVQFWCQNNYLVVITDGQANGDSGLKNSAYGVFNNKLQRTAEPTPGEYCRWNYTNGWGDLDARDTNHDTSGLYCPGSTCWLTGSGGTDYLDDVAFFMYHQDMFPTRKVVSGQLVTDTTLYDEVNSDPRLVWGGDQRISTYAVGLTLRNDLLAETAANGHGLNFTASNYQDLSDSFVSILENIAMREDPMMYTTYAAPKQSVTSGRYGYVAHFVPRTGRSMWEGHLRRFRLGDDGNFPDNIDLLNASNRGTVTVGGAPVPSYQWDVEETLLTRTAARVVYSAKAGVRVDFNSGSITRTDLGVATDALRDTVKSFITNFNSAYTTYKYGDTFHFNPLLVGYPLKWKSFYDASYKSFFTRYSTTFPRTEVVYVGANDGKLHCFASETGSELWSFIPPSQLTKLSIPALNPENSSAHTYFIDGKALVKDIKVSNLGDYRDWKTVLFFGMGIGGHSYCALDVTDPTDDGYSATNTNGRMGFTEAKPVVVDINDGTSTFPAVILAGGYNEPEVPADSSDAGIQDYIKKEGKALYILNAATGAVVKKFVYGTAASNSTTLTVSPSFTCAMTAAPAVLDKNGDGVADYIYQADTGDYHVANNRGGKIWKINCLGNPLNWQAQELYQADAGQTIFISPSLGYDDNYRLLVMFGTGRRSQPTEASGSLYTNLTGQFVCFMDTAAGTFPLTNADLTNITASMTTETDISLNLKDTNGTVVSQGLYTNFVKASNEILFEPSPLYLANKVYFMTFAPQGAGGGGSSDDPCSGNSADGGQHYIYNFGLKAKGNTVSVADLTAISGKILGYGALSGTQYKLYIGQSNVGGFVSTTTPPIELDNVFGPMLWKEEKH
jgi:Tfp pilus tip-associated adhesin PilY1